MKSTVPFRGHFGLLTAIIAWACAGDLHRLDAEETKNITTLDTAEQELDNSAEFTIGGLVVRGDRGQAEQQLRMSNSVFGGISNLHMEQSAGKFGTLKLDGHAILQDNDFNVRVELLQDGVGFIRAGFQEYRTWYDGNGGYDPNSAIPGDSLFFAPANNALALDRGLVWVEFGLRMPDLPEITLRYAREFRHGEKDSTIWGEADPTPMLSNNTRSIVPAFRTINEHRDLFSADASQTFGNTDIGIGIRYEHTGNNDSLNLQRNPGEATSRDVTQDDKLSSDLFSAHGTSESRFGEKLWLTTAYAFSSFNSNIGGSRIYGADFGLPYSPLFAAGLDGDPGFINLIGGSEWDQHVANLNLMWLPNEHLTIVAATRYEHQSTASVGTYIGTSAFAIGTTTPFVLETPTAVASSDDTERIAESLEMRYTGVADWVFYGRGEWTEEQGTVIETSTDLTLNAITLSQDIDRDRLFQKYTVGSNWYPCRRAALSFEYFHKIDDNDYSFPFKPAPGNYPGFFTNQEFDTDDLNLRVTLHPLSNLSLVTRYDFECSRIYTTGDFLASIESAETTNHIIGETVTWSPLSRMFVQASASYVLNQTDTPATLQIADPTAASGGAILGQNFSFKNNYWTASASLGYALDEKTDFQVAGTYYHAGNYENTSLVTQPYGATATEYTVSASVTRQITRAVHLTLKYAYFNYTDKTSGGFNDFSGHLISTSLGFRF